MLIKLKERAHAALAASGQGLGGSSTRPVFLGAPQIKTEDDGELATELSVLGGMTRLVARRNTPSSPSYSASSPSSPNLPPSTTVNSPSRLTTHTPSIGPSSSASSPYGPSVNDNSNPWPHNYTHIQNLNVNINVGDYPSYPSASTSTQSLQHSHQQQRPAMRTRQPATSHLNLRAMVVTVRLPNNQLHLRHAISPTLHLLCQQPTGVAFPPGMTHQTLAPLSQLRVVVLP